MAVTLSLAASNTLVPSGSVVTISATFANDAVTDVAVSNYVRTMEPPIPGSVDAPQFANWTVPASSSITVPYGIVFSSAIPEATYTVGAAASLADGTTIAAGNNPVITVVVPAGGTLAEQNAVLAQPGDLWFDSNLQSGLLAAF